MSLLSFLEPEELIGHHWHRLVGDAASYPRHADAAVSLSDMRGPLGVFFRGLGGGPGVAVAAGDRRTSGHRLSWRQRLGMADERFDCILLDGQNLLLPPTVDLFPDRALNRHLYLWLAAFFAHWADDGEGVPEDPLRSDLLFLRRAWETTTRVLAACPGLSRTHASLSRAVLEIRPRRRLPAVEAAVETLVAALLSGNPPMGDGPAAAMWRVVAEGENDRTAFRAGPRYQPFLPVPLWGAVERSRPGAPRAPKDDVDASTGVEGDDGRKRRARRRQSEQAEREDSLILNNMEKILGLAEMIDLNRTVDDDDADNAKKAADDLDEISLTTHERKTATKLRLDLDLPPDAVDPTRLRGKFTYPEWDYRLRDYHRDHCVVLAGPATEEGEDWAPDPDARRRIHRVQRQFEALRPRRVTLHRQPDGNELDMDALVRARSDLVASGQGSNQVYLDSRAHERDMAVALLVDVSLSTDAWFENRRVLDMEKEALLTLSSGLEACGDAHAIYTFTSRKRAFVRVETVKGFDERPGPAVRRRVSALKPGFYTRIGAALRHVSSELQARPNRHRLVLLLTDGKPNDVDHYEGRYGIEDTRRAIQEARQAGVAVFGVTVDREARDYFPYLFGRGAYHIVAHVGRLSAALPKIYRQLVG